MLLPLNGRRIYYDLMGPEKGPVVCFTHSLSSEGGMWAEQTVPLLEQGCRVLRVDMRGHGGSDPVTLFTSMDQLAGDVGSYTTQAYWRDLSTGAIKVASRDPGATSTADEVTGGWLSRDGTQTVIAVAHSNALDPTAARNGLLAVTPATGVSKRLAWYVPLDPDYAGTRRAADGAAISRDGGYVALATTDASAVPGYVAGTLTAAVTRLR